MSEIASLLTIEELEEGARLLGCGDLDCSAFWHRNGTAFGQTLLMAIQETSEALSSETLSPAWRGELEGQMELLRQCLDVNYGVEGHA